MDQSVKRGREGRGEGDEQVNPVMLGVAVCVSLATMDTPCGHSDRWSISWSLHWPSVCACTFCLLRWGCCVSRVVCVILVLTMSKLWV